VCKKEFNAHAMRQIYCSRECASKREKPNWNKSRKGKPLSKKNIQGIKRQLRKYYKAKGRKTPRKKHSLWRYKNWTKKILSRDNFTCQDCGQHGGNLQAHHIKSWSEFPKMRYWLSNGITYCPKCHWKRHPNMPKKMFGL
jgi:5-methylcytosine-specific restriction endonuclease McrA